MPLVKITTQDLVKKVEEGWKKDALAKHYGLPVTQMTLALKQAGLTIRKFHRPKFILVDETDVEETESTSVEATEEIDLIEPENIVPEELNLEAEDIIVEEASQQEPAVSVDTEW